MTIRKRRILGPSALTRALREFLATEVAGGVALLAAAVIGITWANSPWQESYHTFWESVISFQIGNWSLALDLRHWVNDGLMALFFLVVAIEIKREFLEGELREPRRAALPVIAAVGGMVVPAAIYLAIAGGTSASRGWGIPMATDIAFALAVAAVVGRGLPSSLRLFLLTLAIVDDLGAIAIIAVFYTDSLEWRWAAAAVALLAVAIAVRQVGVVATPLFVTFGALLWVALHESGVHATLAGVAMGLLAPSRPALSRQIIIDRHDELLDVFSPEAARTTSALARLSVSQMEWLEHGLHPWTSVAIVPVFALANAGVPISMSALGEAAGSPVTWGVLLGLVVGKTVGISLFSWIGCRVGIAELPSGVRWSQIVGVGALGGIGFTVSLFITGLAFSDVKHINEARIGILAAAIAASVIGAMLLRNNPERDTDDQPSEPAVADS